MKKIKFLFWLNTHIEYLPNGLLIAHIEYLPHGLQIEDI
jgi:hypothetical protein